MRFKRSGTRGWQDRFAVNHKAKRG